MSDGLCPRSKELLRQQEFRDRVSREVLTSPDFKVVLDRIAALVVENFADWCLIDIRDDQGNLQFPVIAQEIAQRAALAIDNARLFEAERHAHHAAETAQREIAALYEALEESDKRFRVLIERSSDVFSICDRHGIIQYFSPSVQKNLGYTPESLVGTDGFDLIHPEDRAAVADALARCVQGSPGAIQSARYRVAHADGSWRIIDAVGANFLDEPAIRGIVVTQRDITERERLQEQLHQAQRLDAIGKLAGGVAHDFNNLLSIILGYGDSLLAEIPADTPQYEEIREIVRAGESAASLTRQLLAFSRRQMIEPRPLNLNVIIEQAEQMLRRLIGEDILLTNDLTPNLGVVQADPGQIDQILVNLAANARDAMPRGGRLKIKTRNVTVSPDDQDRIGKVPPGSYVLLSVKDTGVGMDSRTQARIFEPFFTTKEVGRGTGLGLAVVHGIVHQNGGAIDVTSAVGQGTTFRIYFPRTDRDCQPGSDTRRNTGVRRGTETILLVEDESGLRTMIKQALQQADYTVIESETAYQAVDIAERTTVAIHLLVTDVVMPELSGREVAEKVLARRPDTKVLYISGYTDDIVVQHGVSGKRSAFLQKPFTLAALTQKVREVLEQ